MKESINEHDMTKKMMSIMRGGYKPLLKEEESDLNTTQPESDTNQENQTNQETQTNQENNDKIFKCRYFNNIKIVDDNKLFKCGIDEKGKELINIEMNWYKYILNNDKSFA